MNTVLPLKILLVRKQRLQLCIAVQWEGSLVMHSQEPQLHLYPCQVVRRLLLQGKGEQQSTLKEKCSRKQQGLQIYIQLEQSVTESICRPCGSLSEECVCLYVYFCFYASLRICSIRKDSFMCMATLACSSHISLEKHGYWFACAKLVLGKFEVKSILMGSISTIYYSRKL